MSTSLLIDFTHTYEIRRNMDYEAIINFLSSNNNRTDTVSVTITEGESVLEIANTLEKNGALGDRTSFFRFAIPKSLTATLTLSRLKQMRTSVTTSLRAISIRIPTNLQKRKCRIRNLQISQQLRNKD